MKYKTAESVTLGHPDKLSDYIADSILDACLAQDPESRVACEVMLSHEVMMVAGEITTKAKVDYQAIAEAAIKEAGYEPPESYVPDRYIAEAVKKVFDFTPASIIKMLNLKHTTYKETAAFGHFGLHRKLPWENPSREKEAELRRALKEVVSDAAGL